MEPTIHQSGPAGSGGVHLPAGRLHPGSGAENRTPSVGSRRRFKGWTSSLVSRTGTQSRRHNAAGLTYTASGGTAGSRPPRAPKWWKIRLFRGMINDVRRRAPYYWSDWVDAWDYRVVPATVYMYFAKYESPYSPSLKCLPAPSCRYDKRLGRGA